MTYNPRKKNPDVLSMFANAAVGVASALQIKEHMERPAKRKPAKKRGTTTAKRKNPVRTAAMRKPARSKGVRIANPTQPNLFKSNNKHGDLYVLTIGTGDDIFSVYLHDGKSDGFSKRFKTMAAAKAFATRKKVKLVQNPAAAKVNGIISRAWARSKAKREYAKELRLAAAADRARSRRRKAEAKAKANPVAKMNGKLAPLKCAKCDHPLMRHDLFGLPYAPCEVKGCRCRKYVAKAVAAPKDRKASPKRKAAAIGKKTVTRSAKAKAPARKNPKSAIRNPQSPTVPRRRTFEMFQGRPATKGREMAISSHAPARLDQLGDLVELKINGGPTLKFSKGVKLCAANGRLWIAGKRFAKANPSAAANEINPIGEIAHVVYGTHKPHHGDHAYTHYIHKLGEESGRRPILCVDRQGFPVIKGGNYKIEARGIVD